MKKKNLKSLSFNKSKVSLLGSKNLTGGLWPNTGWFCHSDMSECLCSGVPGCPMPLNTNEGPCPSGSIGCNTTTNMEP
ncbi:hypothetical protein [uncultured Kordia sp.]|uniref:hypothetical protein n=1 Tax=uncultured Kordia sp. TaxID=507699 RepID=UPI002622D66F|nr:hypothetical protein [uncultured Kordia sp.]